MKHLLIFVIVIFLSACCGTKKAIDKTTKTETKETAQVITPEKLIVEEQKTTEQRNTPVEEEKPIETIVEKDTPKTDEVIYLEAFDHRVLNELLNKYVTPEGNVNYKGFKSEIDLLRGYIKIMGQFMPTSTWSKEDKLAYWMNAYNAMTIDLIVRNYPVKSIKDIKDPWDERLWKLGDKWYNLNEIEHQILRKMNEPRIHFGIVCASFSCPKLQNKAFTALNVEQLLTSATKEFLSDSKRNNVNQNSIKLSKIFKWFAKDFKQNGSLIDFLNQYSDITISSKAKKSFKDYNWSLNE